MAALNIIIRSWVILEIPVASYGFKFLQQSKWTITEPLKVNQLLLYRR